MRTTVGQVLVNEALPERFRDYSRVMDSKGIESALEGIAKEAPEEYSKVSKALMDVGNDAAFDTGTTIRMSDLKPKFDKTPILRAVDLAEDRIRARTDITEKDKEALVEALYDSASSKIADGTYNTELARKNQLALQVASKARGNKVQLAAFLATPGTYSDPYGRTVPFFIRHSYAEGLSPAEYWAGSYGTRNGVVSTKSATAKGGAFGKLLSASALNMVITEDDCGGTHGIPADVDDDDNLGAVLQSDAGGYEAGTVITKQVLSDLRGEKGKGKDKGLKGLNGLKQVVLRSPSTCDCKDGVCSRCAGIRETGGFPPIGYNLGTNAASAFAERITQGALNTKHCLVQGTMVRMSDGSARPIESLRTGDVVAGCDRLGNQAPARVLALFDNGCEPCVRTDFISEDLKTFASMESTSEHKVLGVAGADWKASEHADALPEALKVSSFPQGHFFARLANKPDNPDKLDNPDNPDKPDNPRDLRRTSQISIGVRRVYDIMVDNEDHLFALACGLVVSNSGKYSKGAGKYQGFQMITSLAKVPKVFPDKAVLSSADGEVSKIEDAPQGGTYVFVTTPKGEAARHYVAPGYQLSVKPGDRLEAGDQMSDGVINPAELVGYKGIGEGRRYWAGRFAQAMRDSGMPANRRNAEVLARSVINTVRLEDEDDAGEGLPGDVVTYTRWAYGFKPRPGSRPMKPSSPAVGKYLEQPALHYTIGTRITPRVLESLKNFKVDSILVNDSKPRVEPFMERIEDSNAEKDDPIARLGTTYLKDRLEEDVQRGRSSRIHSVEPYPAIAKGVEFGTWGKPDSKNTSGTFTY